MPPSTHVHSTPAPRRSPSRRAAAPWLLTIALVAGSAAAQQSSPIDVVLFIGDGVDDHQLTIARDYLAGSGGSFSFDRLPHRAQARVRTVLEDDPSLPEYVADSASSGTALATGRLTSRARIATSAGDDTDIPTILEIAHRAGRRTGLVTTASVTDATPACFAAHVSLRFCEGPDDMRGARGGTLAGCLADLRSAGGAGSIAEQLVASGADLLLGGGAAPFGQRAEDGERVLDKAIAAGYRLVVDAEGLARAPREGKLLGLFGPSTLPVEWIGEGGARALPLTRDESGELVAPEPFSCVDNPRLGTRPTLEAMTVAALEHLESSAGQGFFLMVESASIDKQAHVANPCGEIGETRALDRAVQAALAYQERHPRTLILVTSDHGHAGQILPWPSLTVSFGFAGSSAQHPPGKVARLRTPEGGVLTVGYGTNVGALEEHTGTTVPVLASGPGAERVAGLIDQTEVFAVVRDALGLDPVSGAKGENE
ncbi:MAG TPA: alkaline phosphatase [Thermoanaerobaculia bacterium]|nr:alkaline phosphatase [Thermoanaerobaculia bacterium]